MTDLRKAAKAVLDRWDSSEYAASDLFEELRAALEQPEQEPYDQTALELCEVCCWKTLIPGDGCLNCERKAPPEQRKPLTDYMVHRAMLALNTASCGEFQPTFDEMKSALEAAHGVKGEA